jgi:hypothetical protein
MTYDLTTTEGREAANIIEYGAYVATADIYVDGVLAYAEGDRVPISNVEAHGYTDVEAR